MFELNGEQYSLQQVEEASKQSSMSLDDYISEYGLIKTKDEGNANGVAQTGATVTPTTGQAPESMELESVDISSESQPIDNSPEAIFKRRKQAALDQAAIDQFGEIELEEVVVTAEDPVANKNPEELLETIQTIDNKIKLLAGDNEGLTFFGPGEITPLDSPKRIAQYNQLIGRRKEVNKTLNEKLKEEGTARSLYRVLRKADKGLGEYILSMPSFIYEIGSLVSDPVNRAFGLQETNLQKFEESIGTRPLLDGLIEEQEKLATIQEQYKDLYDIGGGITENLKKGNYSDGFYLLGETLAESAPISLSLMAGGAAGLSRTALTVGGGVPLAAGEMRTQLEEFPEDTKGEMLLKSTLIGMSEGFFEGVFGAGAAGKVYKNMVKELGEDQAKKTFKRSIVSMYEGALQKSGVPLSMVGNGLEEVATQATQNVVNGKSWNEGLSDAFAAGVGGGALYGAPVNLAKGVQLGKETYQSIKTDLLLKPTEFKTVSQAFATDIPTSEAQIKISQSPNAEKVLVRQLTRDVQKGNLTQDQANEVELNFRKTQGAVNQLKPLNLNEQDQGEIVELVKEKNKLQQEIKQVNESALTEPQDQRVKEINDLLRDFSTKATIQETAKVKSVLGGLKTVSVREPMSTKEIENYLLDNNIAKDKSDAMKKSGEGALIFQDPDTKEQTVIVNKDIGSIADSTHEGLHVLVYETIRKSPDTAIRLGESLQQELNKIDPNLIENLGIRERLELYKEQPAAVQAEEVLTLFSDTVRTGAFKFNENVFTKIGDVIRQFLSSIGVKAKFNNGRDVYNFIKDYQRSIEKGKLTRGQERTATEGAAGRLVGPKIETFVETPIAKESRIYQEVETFKDDLVNEQSKDATAFLIADKLQNEVDRRLKIDVDTETREDIIRNFLFDDRRGLLGLLKNYSPARNESIMGYLNSTTPGGKLLDARLIEFYQDDPRYNQIVQSTTDEAVQRKAEAVTSEGITETTTETVTDKPLAKKPTETVVYSDEVLSNAGAANTEALENRITEEIQTAFEGKDVSRFKELKDIPDNLAKLYADMFGIKTVAGISDFKRNFQNFDEAGIRNMRTFLNRNAEDDFRRLPKTKDDKKKATGIKQTKLGKVLYDANDNLVGTLKQYKDILKGVNVTLPTYDGKMEEFNRIGKDGKPLPLYRDSQHYKAALKFHIQNRIAEDVMPDKAKRLSAGLKFSKAKQQPKTVAKPMFSKAMSTLFDLQLPGRLKVDSLLDRLKLDKTLNLKELVLTPEGRKQIVDKFRDEVFILLPKEAWQQRDSFTSTGKNYGVSMSQGTVEEIDGYNQLKEDLSKAIDAAPEAAFGAPVLDKDGNVVDFKISGYATVFKGTQAEIKKKALEFNRKVTSIHETMWDRIAERINEDKSRASAIATYLKLTANDKSSWHRRGAAIFGYSPNPKGLGKTKYEMEHAMPATAAYLYLLDSAIQNSGRDESNFKEAYRLVTDNYKLIALDKVENKKLGAAGYGTAMPKGWSVLKNFWWQRYFNPQVVLKDGGIDPSLIVDLDGKTFQEVFNIDASGGNITPAVIDQQDKIIKSSIKASKANTGKLPDGLDLNNPTSWDRFNMLDVVTRQKFPRTQYDLYPYESLTIEEKIQVVKDIPGLQTTMGLKFSKTSSAQDIIGVMRGADVAVDKARDTDAAAKGISVWDFDDTLATTKSNVLYEMPDGTTGALNAEQFAKQGEDLLSQGAEFDFSEFEKVTKGAKGPMFEKAVARNRKFGNNNVFILTARTQAAAEPIHQFLKAIGLDIPLKNIVGLGDSTPAAKASWIVGKATEGYNDFYFADDAYKNVKAVQDALSVLDVKSKVRQAYIKFSKASALDKGFNDILEQTKGIASEKEYKRVKAEVAGAARGKVFRGIPYSAQDFVGLLYETLSKGKLGDSQMAWYKEHLIKPFARAMNDIDNARLNTMQDYRALKKQLGVVPKDLRKKVPGEPYTREQAVRVYIWNNQGTEVPGISKQDLKDLTEYVQNNAELQVFADQVIAIQKGEYTKPKDGWPVGTITTDIQESINTDVRSKYLKQWQDNVDVIFSEKNMNKLEAAYGKPYRKAMENMLQRMKTGRNRTFSDDTLSGRFTDWLQGSIGTIMFFNTRSALLQTTSAINFINFTDNNPLAAAKAFGNQKQYWSDFMTLINSDFLKARRSGLRFNVTEADIANMAREGGPRAVINQLLQLGFAPTQIADSFAIASGGATFYRNRIKSLTKQGMSKAEAEAQAFEDFRENAEESQQSSRPDRISMQQAGPIGRLILAFANTPAQYARLTDKAIRDLKNNRGDAKTNISKIIYYTTVQNLIFNALQQALFAMAFDDEEPDDKEKKDKYIGIANGMADSLLRGAGFAGAAVSVGKNSIIRIINEMEKKQPKLEKVGYELTKISPPISAKLSRINQAARSYQWDKDKMVNGGWGLDNPAYLAVGNVISALTNVPLDRGVKKINNVVKATDSDLELWERLALFGGWQDWEIGIKEETKKNKPQPRKTRQTKRRSKERKTTNR